MPYKILIAEDEPTILRVIKAYFEKSGYEVYQAVDGVEALKIYQETSPDLLILDIMMPNLDGFEVTKRIRSDSDIPIIIMTALGEEQDMLKGYSYNVDDYIVKPFSPKVLVAKVGNLLSRVKDPSNLKKEYKIGTITINYAGSQVTVDDKSLNLSKTEFQLLSFLIKNQNKACSRELLLDEVWGMDVYVDDRIIDTYIKNLRKELKPYNYIKTVFGIGYKFSIED